MAPRKKRVVEEKVEEQEDQQQPSPDGGQGEAHMDEQDVDEEVDSDADPALTAQELKNLDLMVDPPEEDEDAEMDEEEAAGENHSIGHMNLHSDSVYCIAQHPVNTSLVATGSGDDFAYVFSAALPNAVQPAANSKPLENRNRIKIISMLEGHKDTINCITWSLPDGRYLITGGLEGLCQIFDSTNDYKLVTTAQEVPEVNYLVPTPHPNWPNTFALGGSEGSIWIYSIDAENLENPLQQIQYYCPHRSPPTIARWSLEGAILASADDNSNFFMFDPFGEAKANKIAESPNGALLTFNNNDERRLIQKGIYSMDIHKTMPWIALGGGSGMIRIMKIPQILSKSQTDPTKKGKKATGAISQAQGLKGPRAKEEEDSGSSAKRYGEVISTIDVFEDSVESVAFNETGALLAACSTDGSIRIFDCEHNFQQRRYIEDAHDGVAVTKLIWCKDKARETVFTACGVDGVVRRWDVGGNTAKAENKGLINEWYGHLSHKQLQDGGGVMDMVVSDSDDRIITAGDDSNVFVFDADRPL